MKRVFHHPPQPLTGKKYWRSLDELVDSPDFREKLDREFPQGAAELNLDGVSRRHFLKLMGASTALAGVGLSGCRRPELHVVPFTKSVEWAIPGKPLFYATSMPARRGAIPLVVTTHDGRPTKIEGNPLHPVTKGATDTFAQSSILDLYDPDRSRFFIKDGEKSDEKTFTAFLDGLLAKAGDGAGMAFLVEESNSPTRERLRAAVAKKFPKAGWCVYEPLGSDEAQQAASVSYGEGVQLAPQIAKADVIVALDCDFLGCGEGSIGAIKEFSARRRVGEGGNKMNRLYVVENRYTVTGGMADHRLRCPVSQVGAFALALAEKISGTSGEATLGKYFQALPKPQVAAKFVEGWVEETAADLLSARGRSLVLAGARQPAAVHLLVNAINSALGNIGATIAGTAQPVASGPSIGTLAGAIDDKTVQTLFILGGNPVYNAPADLEWAKKQRQVPAVVRIGLHEDETSEHAHWHVPLAHYLETWSDAMTAEGTYTSVQPMILPLYNGWSENDLLARVAGMPKPTGPELVQATFRTVSKSGSFDADWNKFLHDGFLTAAPAAPRSLAFNGASAAEFVTENADLPVIASADAIEVVFAGDARMDDGRHANNGWLQEAPDPITKLTWDNAALLSPATAKTLGVKTEDVIEIALDETRKLEAPVLIAPGHADHSITLPLGFGRTRTGRVGSGVGFSAYGLRTTAQPYFAVGAKVKRTGRTFPLAITQEHHSMEGRALVREGTLEHYEENPGFAKTMGSDAELPTGPNPSLYSHPPLDGLHQWGMAIDLNTCLGCNACVIACQAENNTPIVGKEQVINGREMHWIRMDRYFASVDEKDEDPEMLTQPMLCQQCENAPCETVCPVNATVHNNEGLNVMAYNRCIGTRYCANNCPFKVRRFNFFDYHQRPITPVKVPLFGNVSGLKLGPLTEKGSPDSLKMQKNPNVTVRMRGVMEKCTFCVQRIQEAKIGQKVKAGASSDVKVPADAFQVACQQACPAEAIVFGDLSNPLSKVSKVKAQEKAGRGYRLLEYLNVESRITYLARIRNPNMKMPGAEKIAAFESEGEAGHAKPKHEERHIDEARKPENAS